MYVISKKAAAVAEQDMITKTLRRLQESDGEVDLKVISKKAAAVAEKDMITKTLRRLQWNRWKAAKELKVSYKTLLTKIQLYSIES